MPPPLLVHVLVLVALNGLALLLWRSTPGLGTHSDQSYFKSTSSSAGSLLLGPSRATESCEVCVLEPEHPLCKYGLDSVRLSRAHQGSGSRVQKVLARALAGEPLAIGVMGASVTTGHGLVAGDSRWQTRFFDDLLGRFPQATMHEAAIPGANSTLLPLTL